MTDKADKVIDFRDSLSSISLLKVTQVFGNMRSSEILEIRGADTDTQQDLFKLLPRDSYEVVEVEDVDGESGFYRIIVVKR